jgi:molybdopterin synthase sulfur carrier subunit
MPITVQIPTPMRDQSGGAATVAVAGATVGDALADLVRQHPGLGGKLFDNGQLRPYVNVTVNDEDIRFLDDLATPVADGQLIDLIPAVAGG